MKKIIPLILVLAIFISSVIFFVNSYKNSNLENIKHATGVDSLSSPTRLDIIGKIQNIDAIKGEITIRFNFMPYGSIDAGNSLTEDIKLITTSQLKPEIVLKKNQQLSSVDLTFPLYDGNVLMHPWDKHKSDIGFSIIPDMEKLAKTTNDSTPQTEFDPVKLGFIPIRLIISGNVQGYVLTLVEEKLNLDSISDLSEEELATASLFQNSIAGFKVNIERSSSTKIITYFIIAMLWLMSLAVLFVAITVSIFKRKFEFGMLTWIGALIFAFFSFRNAAPGVPPIGAYIDYLSFFWAEAILGISLIILVNVYLFRKPQ